MIPVLQAESLILNQAVLFSAEPCPLEKAGGRILREDIFADRDSPAESCSAMDGVAIPMSSWKKGQREFRILGTQRAGVPRVSLPDASCCYEVMTGALIPRGYDCVVPVEDIVIRGGRAVVPGKLSLKKHQYIRSKGKNFHQQDLLIPQGTVLAPPQVALAASVGKTTVLTAEPPAIAFIGTGDEVVSCDRPVLAHQVRSANVRAVGAALSQHGFTRNTSFHLPDNYAVIRSRVKKILADHDVVIFSGGVSMGKYDYIPKVLQELGVKTVFHKVSQRPGKPLWFGLTGKSQPVFGLPGNPVSTLICTYRYVLPFLLRCAGAAHTQEDLTLLEDSCENESELTFFFPVDKSSDPKIPLYKRIIPYRGSDDILSLTRSAGFVEIPARTAIAAGKDPVRFFPWALI